jgi:hypothetical protein
MDISPRTTVVERDARDVDGAMLSRLSATDCALADQAGVRVQFEFVDGYQAGRMYVAVLLLPILPAESSAGASSSPPA